MTTAPPARNSVELHALQAALSAGLEGVHWEISVPSGAAVVTGHAWASEEAQEQGGPVARRSLYEVAEAAVAAVDALGWEHAEQPAVEISPAHPRWHGRNGRYLLRVTFRLKPR
ncbi:hypothetical protein ACWCSD_38865 [Nonomuraea sp. NPDC001684]